MLANDSSSHLNISHDYSSDSSSHQTVLCALFGSHVAHLQPGWLSRHGLSVEVIRDPLNPQILVYMLSIDEVNNNIKKEHFAVPDRQIQTLGLFEAVKLSARENAPRFWPLELDYRIGRRDLGPEECPIFDNPYFCAHKRSADPDSPNEYWGGGMVGWVN